MKNFSFVLLAVILLLIASCANETQPGGPAATTGAEAAGGGAAMASGGSDSFSVFIPKDSANKMIRSYLNSIGDSSNNNDSDLRSLIVDVKALTDYCKQTSSAGFKPVKLKMMFAHTLNYINSGKGNQNCGYQTGKLTMVLALYDSAGNYIYMNGNCVLENLQPCPAVCPSSGAASNNLLQ